MIDPLKTRFLVPLLLAAATLCAVAADKPNIIVIMSDDMDYSDIACYGGEIATPTLDRLAANGLRYNRFYNTGRSSAASTVSTAPSSAPAAFTTHGR